MPRHLLLALLLPSTALAMPGDPGLWVEPMVRGATSAVSVTDAEPGSTVIFAVSARTGQGPCAGGICLDLAAPIELGRAVADADGTARLPLSVPLATPAAASFQAIQLGPVVTTEVVTTEIVDPGEDFAALTVGVGSIDFGGGVPAPLALWSERAIPLVATGDRVVAAAARVNAGKALVWGHGALSAGDLNVEGADARTLTENAFAWMAGPAPVIGVEPGLSSAYGWMTSRGWDVRYTSAADVDTVDIWLAEGQRDRPEAEAQAVRDWVAAGGNLIVGAQAWWWDTSHDTPPALDFGSNRLLRDAGIVITTDWVGSGPHAVGNLPAYANGGAALRALLDHVDGTAPLSLTDQTAAASSAQFTTRWVPIDWRAYYDLADTVLASRGPVVPTSADPVDRDQEPLDAFVLTLLDRYAAESSPATLAAHPAADDFPGAVPASAPRVSTTVTVDATYVGMDSRYFAANAGSPLWASTGLYAAPGDTITVDTAAAGQGLSLRIGAHSDTLWGADDWRRAPALTRTWALEQATTEVASAFGGLVYVEIPAGTALGNVDLTITGAVRAPHFVLGTHSDADWNGGLRNLPGPWAELQGEHFILTVPSDVAATVNNPTALMAFWDDVLEAEGWLRGIPQVRPRRERAAVDRQISAGWMHSGYPFMAHDISAPAFVDLAGLQAGGDWGAFHELGHNHQSSDWWLPGTTEATVNLFTLYAMEQVVGLPPRTGHPAVTLSERQDRIDGYLASGPDFWGQWSVWTALETYLQLQEAFGWSFLRDVFISFDADPPGTVPSDDQSRIDAWVLRTSEISGFDLAPFHQTWGLPVSAAVAAQTAQYPPFTGDAVTAQ